MSNRYIVQRRAAATGDLETTFCEIDARRWEWAAGLLAEAGHAAAADRAASYAAEQRMVADRLRGAVAIGAGEDDAAVTASAIAFGGPLPAGVSA